MSCERLSSSYCPLNWGKSKVRYPVFANEAAIVQHASDDLLISDEELLQQGKVAAVVEKFEKSGAQLENNDAVLLVAACYHFLRREEESRSVILSSLQMFWPTQLCECLPLGFVAEPYLASTMDTDLCSKILRTPRAWALDRCKLIDHWQKMAKQNPPQKSLVSLSKASGKISEPVTKFGGLPNWLFGRCWPISRATGKQLEFLAQVRLDDLHFPFSTPAMAYVFVADSLSNTWDPNSGENAVVIQTQEFQYCDLVCTDSDQGPSYSTEEFFVTLSKADETLVDPYIDGPQHTDFKVGGFPQWLQTDPEYYDWDLILQIPEMDLPFDVNFGMAGVAYVLMSPDRTKAKFLFQC